jgi:ubiquitin-like modifier-activating enzyme ATG7
VFDLDCVERVASLSLFPLQDFKTCDKQALLNEAGQRVRGLADSLSFSCNHLFLLNNQVYEAIASGAATGNPGLLNPFILLSFADLKQQKFLHWFAHPVLVPDVPFTMTTAPILLHDVLAPEQLTMLLSSPLFASGSSLPPYFAYHTPTGNAISLREVFGDGAAVAPSDCWFGFVDPCQLGTHPGWPLR